MRYHCLPTIGAIACFVAMAAARADAQLAELQPGARVRVRAPEVVAGRLETVVIARSGDTVTLTTPRGAPIPVPLGAITTAEVSRGRSHRDGAVKGLKLGTGIGLAMGLLSAIGYDAGSDACGSEPCENDLAPGELIAAAISDSSLVRTSAGNPFGAAAACQE